MKKISLLFTSLIALSLVSCSSMSISDDEKGPIAPDGYLPTEAPDSAVAGGSHGSTGSSSDDSNEDKFPVKPRSLTVAAYNDNEHFDYWKNLLSTNDDKTPIFGEYYKKFAFKNYNRIKINVPKEIETTVSLLNDKNEEVQVTITDNSGTCYLFPETQSENYKIKLRYLNELDKEPVEEIKTITGDTNFELVGTNNDKDFMQVMFVVDATGSMGDEIEYLQSEITDVFNKVKKANSNIKLEFSILMYRDYKDEYITDYFDFNEDINKATDFLNKHEANGGGDFEEAVQVAFKEASTKSWSDEAKTKLLIHVADAPAHDLDVDDWKSSVDKLNSEGIQIITVASSGIDKKTEYFFRCQSLITNGTYTYLTNDSGIGGNHIEATVEEKPTIEYLNSCLIRLINGYHLGEFEDPIFYQNDLQK